MSTFSEWKTRCFSTSGADYPRVGGFHKCSYPYGNGWCFSWKKSSGNPLVQWMRNMGVPLDVAETVMAGLPHALDPTSLLRCSSRAQTCAPRFLPPNDLQMLSETHIELVVYRRYIYINNVGLRFGLFIRYDKHEKNDSSVHGWFRHKKLRTPYVSIFECFPESIRFLQYCLS